MAIYEYKKPSETAAEATIAIKEIPIYGSSRLGQYRPSYTTIGEERIKDKSTALGQRVYEFSNHLQNVLVVIADYKVPVQINTEVTFKAIVVSANDYYPFGMVMEGRKYQNETFEYRYGFNGKEDDKDFGDKQLIQDYGFRLYNPAIARFLSVDPLAPSYPMLTPYQFASNRPIDGIDVDGLEYAFYIRSPDVSRKMRGVTNLTNGKASDIYRQREISYWALTHMYNTDYMLRIKGKDIQVAELEYDANKHPKGVTVYLYKWTNDKKEDIQISENFHVPPNGSSEMIHNSSYDFSLPKRLRKKPIDAYYPVDVKLLDGTYDDHDFIGSYNEFGVGLFYGRATGDIKGYLKGYGYVEFEYSAESAVFGAGIGVSYGNMTGSYIQNYAGTPNNFSGSGDATLVDTPLGEAGYWRGLSLGKIVWEGYQYGFGVGLGTPGSIVLSKSTSVITFPKPKTTPKYEAGWLINLKGKKDE